MNCREIENHIYSYLEAELSPELCPELEEHLQVCVKCQDLLELTRMENAVLKDALAVDCPDEEFTRRVMDRIAERNKAISTATHKPVKKARPKAYWYVASAAAVILLFTAFAPGVYNELFGLNSQMKIAIRGTAENQNMVDKALEIAREDKIMAQMKEPLGDLSNHQPAETYSGKIDAGSGVADKASDKLEVSGDNPVDANAKVKIAMAEPPTNDVLYRTNGTRSDPSLSFLPESPNRYRSYAINVTGPIDDNTSMAVNLPQNFVMEKSINSESAVIYLYSDTKSNQAVEITILPYNTAAADFAQSDSPAEATTDPLPQQLEVIAKYDNNQYLIKLKSSLSNEELLKLAKEMRLGE